MITRTCLNGRLTLHIADVETALSAMPADSIDCVVTSPPYWGLRDYGVPGQIGLEPTLAEHLTVMVRVFEGIRRVLKPSGTLWLNYGDCYAAKVSGAPAAVVKERGRDDRTFRDKPFSTIGAIGDGSGTLKPKDLCMIPNRLAIALQDAGWFVRSEIIWGKSNPMPDSAKDRPATAHEKIFLLTKAQRYAYDYKAVRQSASTTGSPGHLQSGRNRRIRVRQVPKDQGARRENASEASAYSESRNLRNYEPAPLSVWEFATSPFREAHFATFPPELAARAILAGAPSGGVVLDPFGGAGTTALVALRLGRNAQLIEINPDYAALAQRRIEEEWGQGGPREVVPPGPLFASLTGSHEHA